MELRVELARREHDEDVVGVGVHGGDETPGPPDAGLLEHVVVRGLAEEDEVPFLLALLDDRGVLLDDDEGYAVAGELAGDLAADPAVAAENVVTLKSVDRRLHPPPSEIAPHRPLHHELHGGDGRVEERPHPRYKEGHGPQLSRGIERAYLPVSDGGQGDHGHVQRVGEAPTLEDHVSQCAGHGDEAERQDSAPDPAQRHPRLVHRPLGGPPVSHSPTPALHHPPDYSRAAFAPATLPPYRGRISEIG